MHNIKLIGKKTKKKKKGIDNVKNFQKCLSVQLKEAAAEVEHLLLEGYEADELLCVRIKKIKTIESLTHG